MAVKLKFPELHGVEYIDLSQNKQTKLTLNALECEGLKWRGLQKLIGSKIGAGNYSYMLKFVKDNEVHKGMIKAIGTIPAPQKPTDDKMRNIELSIATLMTKINGLSTGTGVSVEMLLESTKQSYQMRIDHNIIELTKKENEIARLSNKLEEAINDLADAEAELKDNSGFDKYFEIGKKLLELKSGAPVQPISNLEDSNPNDIPPGIIQILGIVDWSQVDSVKVTEIINYLNMFIPKLPMKGAHVG